MRMATVGVPAGMALGFAGYFGGFGAFVVVAVLGAVGFATGRFLDGDLDPSDFLRTRGGDRADREDRRR